jgi:predicted dehydrogenase
MVEAFERAGLPLFVAYYRRSLPCFIKVRGAASASGVLGRVTAVTYRIA